MPMNKTLPHRMTTHNQTMRANEMARPESSSTSTPQSPQRPQARVSLLKHLKCPTKSEQSRKCKIEKPTATGSSAQANQNFLGKSESYYAH